MWSAFVNAPEHKKYGVFAVWNEFRYVTDLPVQVAGEAEDWQSRVFGQGVKASLLG
ncbi:MAG: hypothetical protein IKO41_21455 [Lachnospiraceae bacterium]|nr:hypothetical protein [Lachnospiraceae bacterium]